MNTKSDDITRKRKFLGLADRDDQEWFWNEAEGAIAGVHALDMPKFLESEPNEGDTAPAEAPDLDDRVRAVRRFRRVQRAHDHMRERGLEAWVDVLEQAYKRLDFIIEDGGDYRPLRPDEDPGNHRVVNFGDKRMVEVRAERGAERRVNGEREELHLTNGAVVVRGGHVLGTEDASGDVPGLARLAHQGARTNLEESLELASRAYEAARRATDPHYGQPKSPTEPTRLRKMAAVTKADYARLRGVSRTEAGRDVAEGKVPTFIRDGRELILLVEPDDDEK